MIFFAKTPTSQRWEPQEDQDGRCESAPHAAHTFAEVRGLPLGHAIEVIGQTVPPGTKTEIQIFTVTRIGTVATEVQWIGSREER